MSPASDDITSPQDEGQAAEALADESPADEAAAQADEAAPDAAADKPAAKAAAAPKRAAKSAVVKEPADGDAEDGESEAEAVAPKRAAAKRGSGKAADAKAGPGKAAEAKAPAASKAKAKADPATATPATDLPADIFDVQVNVPLIHQVVVAQQAAARQGTHSTKTRGDVRGGGRKPYRQKGTGRARQGSIRAPQFTGGGVVHGPVPRSYVQKTPKKMKAAALRGALSDRARHGLVYVVDSFVAGNEPKTRDALAALTVVTGATPGATAMLVVAEASDKVTWKSLRNAAGVHLIDPGQLNTYDVLVSDRVVFTTTALASFVARTGRAERVGRAGGEEL